MHKSDNFYHETFKIGHMSVCMQICRKREAIDNKSIISKTMQTGLENADLLHGINFSAEQEKSGYQKVLSSKLKFLYYSPCHYDL